MDKTKEEFFVFLHQAINDKGSDAHSELYHFYCQCFARADISMNGRVLRSQFEGLIGAVAELSFKHGLSATPEERWGTDPELQRKEFNELFDKMDTDKSGDITLEEWISYCAWAATWRGFTKSLQREHWLH